jgi:hypothetical protein
VLGALGALTSLIIQPSAAQFEHHARRALDCLPHFYISQPAEAWAGLTALRQLVGVGAGVAGRCLPACLLTSR